MVRIVGLAAMLPDSVRGRRCVAAVAWPLLREPDPGLPGPFQGGSERIDLKGESDRPLASFAP